MNKNQFIDHFIAIKAWNEKGRSLTSWIQNAIAALLVAGAIATPEIIKSNWILLVLSYLGLQFCWTYIGYWWDEKRYYLRENEFNNHPKRNNIATRRNE